MRRTRRLPLLLMRLPPLLFAGLALVLTGCATTTEGSAVPAAPRASSPATDTSGPSSGSAALQDWIPTAENPDPSQDIEGIWIAALQQPAKSGTAATYRGYPQLHVGPDQRVAYDRYPPVGGPHDRQWAECTGTVYTTAVRNENMVHSLEHGAAWISYNPDTLVPGDLEALKTRVTDATMLSPYPGQQSPISLQVWAHQLAVDSAADPRINQFLTALRRNPHVYPETGARCDSPGWDSANPPPLDPTPPGPDAVPMTPSSSTPTTG